MAASKSTILFVHGSWHNPQHFQSIRGLFENAGYPTECPAHVTIGADPKGSTHWLADDAKVIKDAATTLVDAGKDVILVMHSYGGILGSEAIHADLSKQARKAQGKAGGVTHLVYLAAFVILEGQSLASALGGQLPPYITLYDDGTCWMEDPELRFYNDLSDTDKKKYVALLAKVPAATQFEATTYSAFKHIPSTYLYCSNDQGLPLEVQRMMVEVNGGGKFRTQLCDSGHSPFLSQPDTVLKLVQELGDE